MFATAGAIKTEYVVLLESGNLRGHMPVGGLYCSSLDVQKHNRIYKAAPVPARHIERCKHIIFVICVIRFVLWKSIGPSCPNTFLLKTETWSVYTWSYSGVRLNFALWLNLFWKCSPFFICEESSWVVLNMR